MVISNVQLHSTNSVPRFRTGSYPNCRVLKISKWWEYLTVVLTVNKAYPFSSVNRYPKSIHHHHVALFPGFTILSCTFSPHIVSCCIFPLVPKKNINHIKISANPTNTTLAINIDSMSILRPYVEKKISTYFQVGSTYFFDVTSMGKKSRRFDVLCST